MKVIYVSNSFNVGGFEQLTLEIMRQLNRRGFSFEYILLKKEGRLAGELKKVGIPVQSDFLHGKYDISGLPRLLYRLRRTETDLLFVEPGRNALLLACFLARRLHARAVISAYHSTGRWGKKTAIRRSERFFLSRLDGIIACAQTQREFLIREERLPADKLTVIVNGVDHERFRPRQDHGYPLSAVGLGEHQKGIVLVASLTPEKGIDTFIRAAAQVLPRMAECRFFICGDGPERPHLEHLIKELGVADRIRLLGIRRDLPDILPAFHLHVLSSHPFRETLPISTMEAMACGLPTINTDVGSVRDLVVPGETGLIVPPGDPEALAGAMLQLLGDDALRERMGRQARLRIEEHFTLERTVREYGQYFRRIVEGRPSSGS